MRSTVAVSLWFQALSYLSTIRLMSSSSDCLVCAKPIPQTATNDRTSTNLSFITSTQKVQPTFEQSMESIASEVYQEEYAMAPRLPITQKRDGCRIVHRVPEVSRD